MNIYFVVSLPRTGTTSLCQMANICGLKSLHVLKNISFIEAIDSGYIFFADTPFYDPEFLISLLEFGINKNYTIKFIYSHREERSHIASVNKLLNKWQPPKTIYSKISLLDHLCYKKLNNDYIKNHYSYIKKISVFYNINMLDYNFNNRWREFCEFIDKPIPNVRLPHKNKL